MWIEILYGYFFFCLVTSIVMTLKSLFIFFKIKTGLRFFGKVAYLITTGVVTFLFAPIFFLILLFFYRGYELATIKHLTQGDQA